MAAARTPARRRTVITETETTPSIRVPRGRSAAERRLAAVAALHQPLVRNYRGSQVQGIVLEAPETYYVCGECKTADRHGDSVPARWPCTTARLLGDWPGEVPE